MRESESIPLAVDLDGTLIRADLMQEAITRTLLRSPHRLLFQIHRLFTDRAGLKEILAKWHPTDPETLPYREPMLEWLRGEKAAGRYLVLATASHRRAAEPVFRHVGLFDELLATENGINLKAGRKRDALIARFGKTGFDYVGNSTDDLPVWQAARRIYVAGGSSTVSRQIHQFGHPEKIPDLPEKSRFLSLIQALRPHQWIKNLLVLVPLFAAHQYGNPGLVQSAFLAMILFCLTSSAAYVLNDLSDLPNDRRHATKRDRPFASGALCLPVGWLLWPILLVAGFLPAVCYLPANFATALGAYFVITMMYSLFLKQAAILDVLTLAGLYTLRIVAGAEATDISLSFWLAAFSLFFFLSLAFVKRFSEIHSAEPESADRKIHGRGYTVGDRSIVSSLGTSAGYLSVLVLALYIRDGHTTALYATPTWIWPACPLLLYWISRVWILAHRGEMHDDPVVFAVTDPASWAVGLLFLGFFGLARFLA